MRLSEESCVVTAKYCTFHAMAFKQDTGNMKLKQAG